jgi:DnaK suppressor protein
LDQERARVREILGTEAGNQQQEHDAEQETGGDADPAASLTTQGVDDAVAASLRDRLAAIDRAEQRLNDGTFGRSVRSGEAIPDARLEADPTAELTVVEAESDPQLG